MNALELIPSVFFDGIARVVPGITAIAAYLLLSGHSWSQILEKTLGPPFATTDAFWPATGLLFLSAYIVGQLIAPLAKLAQRIGKSMRLKKFGKRLLGLELMPKADRKAYDFLRLYHKDAGAQC